MKREDITYQDKLNELRLDISHPNNRGLAFVFVEGETDIRLFRKFFNLDNCKVENIPGGKLKLEECVKELLKVYSLIIPYQLNNGHDFIKALSEFLRKKGRSNNVNDDVISSILRTNFRHEFLVKTLLYQNTKLWADTNNCSIYL